MFSFVMEMEGVDFKGALELLARKAGVDLEQFRPAAGRAADQIKSGCTKYSKPRRIFIKCSFLRIKSTLEYVFKKRQFTQRDGAGVAAGLFAQ